MTLVTQHIQGMFDGISQQSDAHRHPTQCEDQLNSLNRVADGSTKRPPLEHVAKVNDTSFGRAYIHTINRDLQERYNVVVTDGDLRIHHAETGEELVVGFPDGKGYLECDDPKFDFSLVTVADYTFVVNKTVTAKMDTDSQASGSVDTTYQDMIEAKDDEPSDGTIAEIRGSRQNLFDGYYARRDSGSFVEVSRPGELTKFDPETMPHALIRQEDGTFTFQQIDWEERGAGDDNTNPRPTFIDNQVSDVFFYQNRLCFLSGENVVMSRSGQFFNFWRQTATDLLDTDPIDIAVTGTTVNKLHHGVPFNRTLMLFSGQNQFLMNHGQTLSPRSVTADPATSFEASTRVKPVGLGPSVFFPVPSGRFTTIREYFVQEGEATNDAADVTEQVPRFIPEDVDVMTAATNEGMLFVHCGQEPGRIYAYRMHWGNNEKVQSAWGPWEVPGEILSLQVLENYLMVLTEHDDGVYLNRINLRPGQTALGLDYNVHLDRRLEMTGTYEGPADETRFELPYDVPEGAELVLVYGSDFDEAGQVEIPERLDDNLFAIPGDYSGGPCALGFRYTHSYTFSRIYYRQRDNSILTGRLQLRNLWLNFRNTGFFRVKTYRDNKLAGEADVAPGYAENYSGRIVGQPGWSLESPSAGDGVVRLPARGNTRKLRVTLENDSPYPSQWVSGQWEGEFVVKTRLA